MLGVEVLHSLYGNGHIARIRFISDGDIIYVYVSNSKVLYPVKYYELSVKEIEFIRNTISDYGFILTKKIAFV